MERMDVQQPINMGLERMERLMEKLRHPERRVKTIHVAGTNGKGSTTAFLREMLKEANFFVGTYTSPYWETPAEQISINGENISEEELHKCLKEIEEAITETEQELQTEVTEFERITTAALYYFSTIKPVDIAIIETGMGGRLDATNVITPLVTIITNVGKDHEAWLGDTVRDISREKAGVIKSGVPVMTAAEGEAFAVIEEESRIKHAKLYIAGRQGRYLVENRTEMETRFQYKSSYKQMDNLKLTMLGDHQVINATLALMALDYMKQYYAMMIDDEAIRIGLERTAVPGRLERVKEKPIVLLDTAHNPMAVETLVKSVKTMYPNTTFTVLFAAMKDKDDQMMIALLKDAFVEVVVTSFDHKRAASIAELTNNSLYVETTDTPLDWFEEKLQGLAEEDGIIITGSQDFVGRMRHGMTEKI